MAALQPIHDRLAHSSRERLAQANRRLEERNEELLQLTYAISHDLQSPVATISGSIEALERRLPSPTDEQRLWLERMRRAADRMVAMLNDLMLYARSGATPARRERVEVAEQMRLAIDELEGQVEARRIALRAECSPCEILADSRLLFRVFMNLLSNAVKHAGERGEGRIDVQAARSGDLVRVTVADNGPGIDPTRLGDVFKPFTRASDGTGTGLGLSIVRRCVDALGGRVWLESDGHAGTTAVLEFPAAPGEEG